MKETDNTNDSEASPPAHRQPGAAQDATRDLLLMRAGERLFSVFAEESDGVAESLRPTPLPGAPPAVVGVVCIRGRMRTVLNPLLLLSQEETDHVITQAHDHAPARLFVALRGDEQLALAVEHVERLNDVSREAFQPPPNPAGVVRYVFQHRDAPVHVLHPSRLFEAAMQGTERRRPR